MSQDLLAEPLNLVSNFSFIFAAIVHIRQYLDPNMGNKRPHKYLYLYLIILVFTIGVGSSLFHSFATRWAMLADVIPIGVYLVSYLPIYMMVCGDFKPQHTVMLISYFAIVTLIGAQVPSTLANGSQNYFGALITLASLGVLSKIREHTGYFFLLKASGILCFSLFFRAIDEFICPILPMGTHFLWHLCNGLVLYQSLHFVRIQIMN